MNKELQEQLKEILSGCSIPSERISSYCNILSFIDQNFIGKEVIKKIELMRYTEEIKEMRGTEYANGWSDAVDKLLELLK
jgi:hypothetical protein